MAHNVMIRSDLILADDYDVTFGLSNLEVVSKPWQRSSPSLTDLLMAAEEGDVWGGGDVTPVVLCDDITHQLHRPQPTEHDAAEVVLQYWMNGVATNILVIVGLIANALTLAVLCRRLMTSSTNSYLSALAVWDSVVLVCTGLMIGLPAVCVSYQQHAYVVSYIYPLALIAQTATIWLTVSFTVERYIAVSHPLQAAGMCTVARARLATVIVSIASTIYNIPRWFEYRPVIQDAHNSTSVDGVGLNKTEFGSDYHYRLIYYSYLYLPVMCIVPLLILSILNLYLILAVRRSRNSQRQMNVKQSRENNVTIMLSAVVVVFVVCQVPALVYNISYALLGEEGVSSKHYKRLSHVRNFLVNVNSAVNFMLYCAFGQKFRRVFLMTFFRYCINRRNHAGGGSGDEMSCTGGGDVTCGPTGPTGAATGRTTMGGSHSHGPHTTTFVHKHVEPLRHVSHPSSSCSSSACRKQYQVQPPSGRM